MSSAPTCQVQATTQHLSSPPYENYFYSDCNVDAQVVVTSPLPDSNLSIIGPRLIVAWPAGNSGVCAYFAPQNGVNGSLGIEVVNSTVGSPVGAAYAPANSTSGYPNVGVTSVLRFNSSAALTVSILGSVRTIRDFTEGPSLLRPEIQGAIKVMSTETGGASLHRLWLDNVTTTYLNFTPSGGGSIKLDNQTLMFEAGDYTFSTTIDYPQLTQLTAQAVLNPSSQSLISQQPDQTTSLSFLSYSQKLLAGAWRFLTYFGRDSMIATLLLDPVLSQGNGSAYEAVIGAVLERINRTDGSVCHEETIGDYATYLNEQMNITSTAPSYSYVMIDSDLYLPVVMEKYFVQSPIGQSRISDVMSTPAGTINPVNKNLTWGDLALINAEKIMGIGAVYAAGGNQTKDNLLHLKEDQIVGQWRDSTFGIGGGRIPYDVNTALIPAALRGIASLARAGVFSNHSDWGTLADNYAQVWEDTTLQFFAVSVPFDEAQKRLNAYGHSSNFPGPSQSVELDADVSFHALSLDGYNNLSQVQVMNTDDCFRHFLLNTTNQTQLTSFLNQTANNVRRTFPAGLLTSQGMVIANPAYGLEQVYAQNWTTSAYHGTVIWSWQLAMMAKGLENQLSRCNSTNGTAGPDFCTDDVVYQNVVMAYNSLWDSIEQNTENLSTEVWSWVYRDGDFQFADLGSLPPPPGVAGSTGMKRIVPTIIEALANNVTESDIRQLWSLTFLAVTRNQALR